MTGSKLTIILFGAGVAATVAWAAQAIRVSMDGKTVSTSARMFDGSVYVKLSDVARALDMQVVGRNGSYDLVKAGGANQLQGLNGKMGTEMFTGKWKFLVKDVQRFDKYMLKYADSKFELTPDSGMEVVVVNCRFKNGVRESANIYFNGMGNTALTDMEEHGYKIKWMDSGGGVAEDMLPGSAKDFALVFFVPKGTELKDLIYTVEAVDIRKFGKVDLRISLR